MTINVPPYQTKFHPHRARQSLSAVSVWCGSIESCVLANQRKPLLLSDVYRASALLRDAMSDIRAKRAPKRPAEGNFGHPTPAGAWQMSPLRDVHRTKPIKSLT
jgi:hypothetical protein